MFDLTKLPYKTKRRDRKIRANFFNYFMTFLTICNRYLPRKTSEAVKKLVHCASAHKVGGLVQALEGGSLDVMGNLRFQ